MPLKSGHVLIRPEGWLDKKSFKELWFPLQIKAPGFFHGALMHETNIVLSVDSEMWRSAEYVISECNPDYMPRPFEGRIDVAALRE